MAVAITTTQMPIGDHGVYFRRRCEIVTVISVSRAGWVLRYRTAWGTEVTLRRFSPSARPRVALVDGVDAADAEAVAKAHHWPGHPDQPKSFETLEQVSEALAPLRKVAS